MQVAVIGLGRFGANLARHLAHSGAEVIAIDRDEDLVRNIADVVQETLCMDTTDEAELERRNIIDVDVVVVAIGEDILTSILTTAILRRLGALNIVARASNKVQAEILKEVGARKIVFIEEEMAKVTAQYILSESAMERQETIPGYSFAWMSPLDSYFGKKLKDLDIRQEFGLNLVGIRRKIREISPLGETLVRFEMNDYLEGDEIISEEDTLLLYGANELLDAFSEEISNQ